jgi:hypothetical protein
MRARKPWTRARRILEGWYVRFMASLRECAKGRSQMAAMPQTREKALNYNIIHRVCQCGPDAGERNAGDASVYFRRSVDARVDAFGARAFAQMRCG